MFHCHNVFIDVLPCDYLDNFRWRKPTYLVVNTDDSSQPGEHWVAIAILDRIYFMCSYGMAMDGYAPHFRELATRMGKRVVQQRICLQNDGSNVCGKYALYFLFCKFKNQNFYAKFGQNRHRNDIIVNSLFTKFKKCIVKTNNAQCCKKK
jgi:hypothetical protein